MRDVPLPADAVLLRRAARRRSSGSSTTGDGEIYSFTVIRHAVIPPVADALPLVAAVVELPDTGGCRLVGNVVDCEPDDGADRARR